MKFAELVQTVSDEPCFETGLLLAGDADPLDVRHQLSRWVESGQIFQLRRGLYTLAPPFQKIKPHPFVLANAMVRGSYVSCQSALEYYGMIPEYTPVTTSVSASRPGRWETPLGTFDFRHVKPELLRGYRQIELGGQRAFVATPEKALLDLIHLYPGGDDPAYLRELRLQNLENLDLAALAILAEQSAMPKLRRAAKFVAELAQTQTDYETL
jgi:predicted transcriptional regulator of viral defense system